MYFTKKIQYHSSSS